MHLARRHPARDRIREALYRRLNVSFSKSGEDIQVRQLVRDSTPGTYVDVGCWHPTKASNSYYFSLRGWRGICIDPNPQLASAYADFRPGDTFVNCAISRRSVDVRYYMLSDANSSMNTMDLAFLRDRDLEGDIQAVVDVPTHTLEEVLSAHIGEGERIDFFDIDVEGADLEVLKSNDWTRFRPKVVLVESDLPLADDVYCECTRYLNEMSYRLLGKSVIAGTLGNLLFVDDTC